MAIVVMQGDGIGPEITAATLAVLAQVDRQLALGLEFEPVAIGLEALRAQGTTLPDAAVEAARRADGVILGPVSHNDYPPAAQGGLNPSGELRRRLDLFANIRPARSRPGLPPRCGQPVDLVIARENTEGFYADRSMFLGHGEFMPTPDLALSLRKITRAGSTRIAEAAFALAARRRRKVTAVHKANVLRVSDGLFLECVRAVAARHPDVAYEERIMDAMAALLVRDASRVRRDRDHQHVRRHPVGRGIRNRRQPGSRRRHSTPARGMRWRRRSTARRPTSPAATSPIRPRSSAPPPCCSPGSASGAASPGLRRPRR